MKVFLFWAVATWVVAVIADRPCAEYCVYLSSGARNIEFQPGCDCIYEETEYQRQIDDSNIYYEPRNDGPIPVYFNNEPLYMLNPVVQGRHAYSSDNKSPKPRIIQPTLKSRSHVTTMDLNVENTHSNYNRHEKDTHSNKQRLNAPVYLDIDVESEDVGRSASKKYTAEELNLTEQSLLECTNLFTALHSSKNSEKHDKTILYLSKDYPHLSNKELEKMIQNKCSHISYIVQESLNEIKNTRYKMTGVMFRMDDDEQLNNKKSGRNNIHPTTENTLGTSVTENNLQSSQQSNSKIKDYNDYQEQATITYTEYDERGLDNLKTTNSLNTTLKDLDTLPSDVSSTNTARASTDEIQNTGTPEVAEKVTKASIKIQSTTQIPLQHKSTTVHSITMTSEALSENTVTQEITKEKRTNKGFQTRDFRGLSENRPHYNEGEVPLVKIITHEYSNDTVQSFTNGTEDIPNGDFKDELKPTEIVQSTPTAADVETNAKNSVSYGTTPDISGKLYFYFNKHQIPAKFVQNSNGSIYLGVDGINLCNTLTKNSDHNSVFMKKICNCNNTGNCRQNDTD